PSSASSTATSSSSGGRRKSSNTAERRAGRRRWRRRRAGSTAAARPRGGSPSSALPGGPSAGRWWLPGWPAPDRSAARWRRERLLRDLQRPGTPRPYFPVVTVPRLFERQYARAHPDGGADDRTGRFLHGGQDPNRNLPAVGQSLDTAAHRGRHGPVDAEGRPM